MRRENTHYFIFPEYLDKTLTRKEGRRLSLDLALDNPTITEIRLAAEKLEYNYEVQKYAAYPRQWWERKGLILIEKKKPKLQTLKDLSKEIKVHIRPALEKQKKALAKEAKKRRTIKQAPPKKKDDKGKPRKFRPKRRK
ncbi:MAG: signal recognition particle subunit SRP19/SEC65 family protein [Promethearchaeota archaeon]